MKNKGLIPGGDEAYFAFDAVNASRLKLAFQSFSKFERNKPIQATEAMRVGSAFHSRILTPELFTQDYALYEKPEPEKTMGSKANKAAYQALKDAGIEPLCLEKWEAVERMAQAIFNNPTTKKMFHTEDGKAEQGRWWVHECGVKCKIKPDKIVVSSKSGRVVPVDLKKCQDASPEGFKKYAQKYDLPIQNGLYEIGLERWYDSAKLAPFTFVLVEEGNDNPKDIGIYRLPETQVIEAKEWINHTLCQIKKMQESGDFPGYYDQTTNAGIQEIWLSEWYMNKYEILQHNSYE